MTTNYYATLNFLQCIFAPYFKQHKGFIEYRGIKKMEKGKWHFHPSLESASCYVARSVLEAWNEHGRNIYFGVCPRTKKSGTKNDVAYVTAFWADLDANNYSDGKEEAWKRLQTFHLTPSAIVDSGHGYHAYWFLDEVLAVNDIPYVEGYIKGIALALGGDFVHDLSRVMRLPGFMNVKNPNEPLPCVLLEEHFDPEKRYVLDDFKQLWVKIEPKGEKISLGDVPVEIPERFWKILKKDKKLSRTWLGTRSMPNDNSRSGYDMSVASLLIKYNFKPEEMAAILSECPSGKGREGTLAYQELTISKAMRQEATAVPEAQLGNWREFCPAQDTVESVLHIAIQHPVPKTWTDEKTGMERHRMETETWIVRSDRTMFELTEKELYDHRLYTSRIPAPGERWSWGSVKAFTDGEATNTLSEAFSSVRGLVTEYLDLGDPRWTDYISVWILGTYFHRYFGSYPYLHLNGNRASGKTKSMQLIGLLAFNGRSPGMGTAASVQRLIHDSSCTVAVDEADDLRKSADKESSSALIATFNQGYKIGEEITKCGTDTKRRIVVERFDPYSPKVFGGIEGLDHTLASRSVPITMVTSADKTIKNREIRLKDNTWQETRNAIYTAVMCDFSKVATAFDSLEDSQVVGREWELWKPIFATTLAIDSSGTLKQSLRDLAIESNKFKQEILAESNSAVPMLLGLLDLCEKKRAVDGFYPYDQIKEHLAEYDSDTFGWMTDEKNPKRKYASNSIRKNLRHANIVKGAAELRTVSSRTCRGFVIKPKAIEKYLEALDLPSSRDNTNNANNEIQGVVGSSNSSGTSDSQVNKLKEFFPGSEEIPF